MIDQVRDGRTEASSTVTRRKPVGACGHDLPCLGRASLRTALHASGTDEAGHVEAFGLRQAVAVKASEDFLADLCHQTLKFRGVHND